MASVGIIINDKSDRSQSVLDELLYVSKRFSNIYTEVLDGVRQLGRVLSDMNRKKVDTLILAGGDGTLQAVFTDAINNRRFDNAPGYVALPCGMTNVIAADCGLQGDPARSLDRFLIRRQKGEVRPLRRSLLSVSTDGSAPVYGFFLGAGAFCSAVDFSRARVQSKGVKRTVALVASVAGYVAKVAANPAGTIDPIELDVVDPSSDDKRRDASRLRSIYLATTLSKLGGGIYPFWG
ncbi:MAG: diacylglycerol kinase family protein, partial [Pseudomonadota bacterium]